MLRATGPGKVEIDADYSQPGVLKALLYNFDFDGDAVKPEHRTFLLQQAIPLLGNDKGHVWMQGSASRIGAAAYNMALSQRRVQQLANFLKTQGIQDVQMQLNAIGATMTANHIADDELDRAVALVVLPKNKIDPPPPRPVPPPAPTSDRFRIQLVGDLSLGLTLRTLLELRKLKLGVGLAGDIMFFRIWDYVNGQACIYVYVGAGLGLGLHWLSSTFIGPWNDFQTSAPIRATQFEGPARFTTAGAASYTLNYLNLLGTPSGVDGVYLRMNTGTTVGAGLSTTVGGFYLLDGPAPFSGP